VKAFYASRASAISTGAIGIALLAILPLLVDEYTLIELTIYVVMAILSVSLAFVWGFGGILCFGQSAFFGLGAYAYAVTAVNVGNSTLAVLCAIAIPAIFAILLGYVIFYGRLSDVYMGVITLTVTLILFNLINSTSGPEWHIGIAQLGGFNGMPSLPTLNWPGTPEVMLTSKELFVLSFALLIAIYIGLRALLASKIGKCMVATRENEQRMLLLGYDVRAYKLLCFTIGGAIAGLAGCLFATWGAFTSPTIFGLAQSAQIIIWVIVGGLGTLVGPIIGCVAIQWLVTQIGSQQTFNANLVLGAILVGFVVLVPRGIVPTIGDALAFAWRQLGARRARRATNQPTAAAGSPMMEGVSHDTAAGN
jgi:ABC-type branched-subunit amino acid transport system permease subunit